MTEAVGRALAYLRDRRNPDGGWGYRPGRRSLVEPTGLGLLALAAGGERAAAGRGLDLLRSCQKGSGALGIDAADPEGSWMAYAALLAFEELGAEVEAGRLAAWALAEEDASRKYNDAEIAAISQGYRYNATIRGWPWTPGTTAWVEPTALFMIALVRAGVAPGHDRIRSGVRLLVDRRVRSGGWNFGNPYSRPHELEPGLMSTALALAALAAAACPEDGPGVSEGFAFLERSLEGPVGTASLAWSLLALLAWPCGARLAAAAADRLARLQAPDGGFGGSPFETALAALVLGRPEALVSVAARHGEEDGAKEAGP